MTLEQKPLSSSPMLDRYKHIVLQLQAQLTSKEHQEMPDSAIYRKYGVMKFQLVNSENEPVEAWIYNKKNTPDYPVIEDQGLRAAEAIIKSAKHVFQEEKLDAQIPLLDDLMKAFQDKINLSYLNTELNDENFYAQFKEIKRDVLSLLSDVAYMYALHRPGIDKVDPKVYKEFYEALWKTADTLETSYLRNNILVINQAAQTVQYYERGTDLQFIHPDALNPGKNFTSAHKRDEVGVPNFIAYATGHIASDGQLYLTDTGFRHGSLPPIDLYQQEDKQDDVAVRSIQITTRNMELLGLEMQKKIGQRPGKIAWVNVSLLTAMNDAENQWRQFEDTILAADRLRSRGDAILLPITFDFGVNIFATNRAYSFFTPAEQIFENNRAFIQLHSQMSSTLIKAASEFAPLFASLDSIAAEFKNSVEDPVLTEAKAFDAVCKVFEAAPTEENSASVKEAKLKLDQVKRDLSVKADELLKSYSEKVKEVIPQLEKIKVNALPVKIAKAVSAAIKDFKAATEHYFEAGKKWNAPENNFKLQARIIDLGVCLSELGASIATSWNCKSNNDRSAVLAAMVDYIRAERLNQVIPSAARFIHYLGSAWSLSPILDTMGGGPKFGAREVNLWVSSIQLDYGHPVPTLAKMQEETSELASHYLEKKSLKFSVPTQYKLMSLKEALIEQKEMVEDVQQKYLEILDDLFFKKYPEIEGLKGSDLVSTYCTETLVEKLRSSYTKDYEYEPYFAAEMIEEYVNSVYENSSVDSMAARLAGQVLQALLIDMLEPARRKSTLSFYAQNKPVITSGSSDNLKKEGGIDYDLWLVQINKDRGIKPDSASTLAVIAEFKNYAVFSKLKNKRTLERLIMQYQALKVLHDAVRHWLNEHAIKQKSVKSNILNYINVTFFSKAAKKEEKEGVNENVQEKGNPRYVAMEELRDFTTREIGLYKEKFNEIQTVFLFRGGVLEATRMIEDTDYSPVGSRKTSLNEQSTDSEVDGEESKNESKRLNP